MGSWLAVILPAFKASCVVCVQCEYIGKSAY